MGLFSGLKKAAKSVIKKVAPIAAPVIGGFFGGQVGADVGRVLVPGRAAPGGLPALPPGLARPTRLTPPITGRLPRSPVTGLPIVPRAAGMGVACPPGFHPAKDGSGRCVRNRRMNPLNPRAARRAIRRIKGAMRMLKQIERQLPKQRTRRAPAGHRARLTHD